MSLTPGCVEPGSASGSGTMGPPGFDADEPEMPYIIPGPAGPQGIQGVPGSGGSGGGTMGPPGLDADEPEMPYVIPGPVGATGPAGGGAGSDPSYSPGSFTVATETARAFFNHLKLTGSQRATLAGTCRLRLSN